MKRLLASICILTALAASVSAQTVAFTNVSVIPMDRERVLANQTVVIKNGLIAEIGDAKKVKLPKDAKPVAPTKKKGREEASEEEKEQHLSSDNVVVHGPIPGSKVRRAPPGRQAST